MSRSARYIVLLTWILLLCVPCTARGQRTTTDVVQDIRSAYENLDLAVATARITVALDNFERFSPAELSEIYKISALVRFSRGDEAGTREHLALALQVNPDLIMEARETPPQLMALFEELRAASADTPAQEKELRYLILQDPRPAAVMRSMLLPGWGQLYKQQQRKGILLMSAWGATSIGTLVAHVQRNKAEDHYLDAGTLEALNDRYPAFDRWHRVRNNLFVAASAIWVYSYIDALLQRPVDTAPLQVYLIPDPAGTELSLKLRF